MRSEPVEGRRVQRLVEIDRGWRARTASDAIRDASDLLGRGYLRLGARLWDLGALAARTWCRPVVLGVMAAEARLDPAQTARLVGFEDVQTAIAAALKLRPFDPALGAAWSMAAARPVEDMFEHPQVAAEGILAEFEHPTVGRYRGMAHPVRFGDGPPPAPLPAPTLGQHAREILASLGYTDAEIERLGREGAVIGVDTRATA